MSLRDIYERNVDESFPDTEHAGSGCPECGGIVHTNSVETACDDCGLVLESNPIDPGPEWRSFQEDDRKRERTGPPLTPTRHDRGLSSEIGFDRTDSNGNVLTSRKRSQIGRLRREQNRGRWRSKAERNLAHGFSEIRRVVSALDLPEAVRNRACSLYRRATAEDRIRGRSIEAMAAGCAYAACRCLGLPWRLEEFVDVTTVSEERVKNAYTVLNREFGLRAEPIPPARHASRFASELDLSAQARRRAVTLARRAAESGRCGGAAPTGFAAACLYQVAHERDLEVTQATLADLAGVSVATVRAHWKTVEEVTSSSP